MDQIEHLLETLRVIPHVAAFAFAYVLALPIGWDCERNERSAGLRTFPLVAVASCGFVQATEASVGTSAEAQARIIEGLHQHRLHWRWGHHQASRRCARDRHSRRSMGNRCGRSRGGPWQLRRRHRHYSVHDLHIPRLVSDQTARDAKGRYWSTVRLSMKQGS